MSATTERRTATGLTTGLFSYTRTSFALRRERPLFLRAMLVEDLCFNLCVNFELLEQFLDFQECYLFRRGATGSPLQQSERQSSQRLLLGEDWK